MRSGGGPQAGGMHLRVSLPARGSAARPGSWVGPAQMTAPASPLLAPYKHTGRAPGGPAGRRSAGRSGPGPVGAGQESGGGGGVAGAGSESPRSAATVPGRLILPLMGRRGGAAGEWGRRGRGCGGRPARGRASASAAPLRRRMRVRSALRGRREAPALSLSLCLSLSLSFSLSLSLCLSLSLSLSFSLSLSLFIYFPPPSSLLPSLSPLLLTTLHPRLHLSLPL